MKFDITIRDLSLMELTNITAKLGDGRVTMSPKTESPGYVDVHNNTPDYGTVRDNTPYFSAKLTAADASDESDGIAAVEGQLDSTGLPWDGRIHSESKKLTGKGVWKKRRGISDEETTRIEHEIRGGLHRTISVAHGAGHAVPAAAGGNVVPQAQPVFIQQPVTAYPAQGMPLPPLPGAPNAVHGHPVQQPVMAHPAPQPVTMAAPVNNIQTLMTKIQSLFQNGTGSPEYLLSLNQRIGQQFQVQINSITDITNRQEMIDYAFALMAHDGK